MSQFQRATKQQAKLRLALCGPAGSGKTMTANLVAQNLGSCVALIDTEHGSASKYAGLFAFDVLNLTDYDPRKYRDAIRDAANSDYDVLIIDSLSHAWQGTLELKDQVAKRSKSHDSFGAWREITPIHNELVNTILSAPLHVIATMRTKTEYLVEKGADGRNKVTKVGLAPIQRDGVEYEFDVVGDMDLENNLIISKSRCPELAGAVINQPAAAFAAVLKSWLEDGEPPQSATTAREAPSQKGEPVGPPQAVTDVSSAPEGAVTAVAVPSAPLADEWDVTALRDLVRDVDGEEEKQLSEAWKTAGFGSIRDGRVSLLKEHVNPTQDLVRKHLEQVYARRRSRANALMGANGIKGDARHAYLSAATGGDVRSTKQLTANQLKTLEDYCKAHADGGAAA